MDDQNGASPREIHLGYLVGLHYQSILPKEREGYEVSQGNYESEFPPLKAESSLKNLNQGNSFNNTKDKILYVSSKTNEIRLIGRNCRTWSPDIYA